LQAQLGKNGAVSQLPHLSQKINGCPAHLQKDPFHIKISSGSFEVLAIHSSALTGKNNNQNSIRNQAELFFAKAGSSRNIRKKED
jgi:hypothetical protein